MNAKLHIEDGTKKPMQEISGAWLEVSLSDLYSGNYCILCWCFPGLCRILQNVILEPQNGSYISVFETFSLWNMVLESS